MNKKYYIQHCEAKTLADGIFSVPKIKYYSNAFCVYGKCCKCNKTIAAIIYTNKTGIKRITKIGKTAEKFLAERSVLNGKNSDRSR